MGLFSKRKKLSKPSSSELIQLHSLLTTSFKNVRRDTTYILHWLNYFYHKSLHQEQQITQLREELNYTPKSKEELRKIVDEFYSYQPILNRIEELNRRVEELRLSHLELHKSHNELHQKHHELHQKHQEILPRIESFKSELKSELKLELAPKQPTIKERIAKRITKNSKDYIKSVLLSYIKKYSKITALQLKEMLVEEQGICSKSSFYRLLEELEEEPEIGVIKRGREKHYIAKIPLKN